MVLDSEQNVFTARRKGGVNLSMSAKTFFMALLVALALLSEGFILLGVLGLAVLIVFIRAAWTN
jgi:energy-coupling factor transporter transmembrane protein EcfT